MSPPEKRKRKRKMATKRPLLKPSLELSSTQQTTLNPSLPLPYDLQLTCLASISRLYCPTLSLVSKTFRSLIASPELYKTRSFLNRTESCLYVCVKFSPDSNPRWFTLCRKPNLRRITNRNKKTSGNILVPVPFPESVPPVQASSFVAVGSDIYEIGGFINHEPSSIVSILDCRSHSRNQAPNMLIARGNPSAYAVDGKIYVKRGLKDFTSTKYEEIFDLKTQTWKSELIHGAANNLNEGIYEPNVWNLWRSYQSFFPCCVIDNVFWWYKDGRIEWFDSKVSDWRVLKGIEGQLPKLGRSCDVQLVDYGGKMAVLWHKFDRSSNSKGRVIWCAVIVLERCNSEEISGKVEWIDPVLKVPCRIMFVSVLAPTI